MILFRREFVDLILSGAKTESRRRWRRPLVKEGGVYWAATGFGRGDRFARLKVKYIRRQRLGEVTEEDARREGCSSLEEFKEVWTRIYGSWDPCEEVYVVSFEVVERFNFPSPA